MLRLMLPFIKPTLRHALQAGGAALAAYGFIDESQVEAFIGIAVNIGTALWMWVDVQIAKSKK